MRRSHRRRRAHARPGPRLVLGALSALVGTGVIRAADAPASSPPPPVVAEALTAPVRGTVLTEDFTAGAARALRLFPFGPNAMGLEYETGVNPEVDEFISLLADDGVASGVVPEMDYLMTWGIMKPAPGSSQQPLVRMEVTWRSVRAPFRVIVESEHQPLLWRLTHGFDLNIAIDVDGALHGFNLGPIPLPDSLAGLLTELAVPDPVRA